MLTWRLQGPENRLSSGEASAMIRRTRTGTRQSTGSGMRRHRPRHSLQRVARIVPSTGKKSIRNEDSRIMSSAYLCRVIDIDRRPHELLGQWVWFLPDLFSRFGWFNRSIRLWRGFAWMHYLSHTILSLPSRTSPYLVAALAVLPRTTRDGVFVGRVSAAQVPKHAPCALPYPSYSSLRCPTCPGRHPSASSAPAPS